MFDILQDSALSRKQMCKFDASFSMYLKVPQMKAGCAVAVFVISVPVKEIQLRSIMAMTEAKFNRHEQMVSTAHFSPKHTLPKDCSCLQWLQRQSGFKD